MGDASLPELPEISEPDGRLVIRPFTPADRDTLVEGRDEEYRRFLAEASEEPAPLGCIVVDGAVVGWIDFDDERDWLEPDEVNVGYNIFPEHRPRGYATRAVRLLSEHLGSRTPPRRLTLLIDPTNAPSLAVAAKAGFEQVGEVEGESYFKPGPARPPGPVRR